jgi:hypothetical protein
MSRKKMSRWPFDVLKKKISFSPKQSRKNIRWLHDVFPLPFGKNIIE